MERHSWQREQCELKSRNRKDTSPSRKRTEAPVSQERRRRMAGWNTGSQTLN